MCDVAGHGQRPTLPYTSLFQVGQSEGVDKDGLTGKRLIPTTFARQRGDLEVITTLE